jgi:hypothetical protein
MSMMLGATVYLVVIVLVIWAGYRRVGDRRTYLATSGTAALAGLLAIIMSPASRTTGLAPERPTSEWWLATSGWLGGGLLVLAAAALIAALLYARDAAISNRR